MIALGALGLAAWAHERQTQFQRQVEERQSAPLLIPGAEKSERGRRIKVITQTAPIFKRGERLEIIPDPPRIVIPMRNVGDGAAILLHEFIRPVEECVEEPQTLELPRRGLNRAGYYVVRPGESEQLSFLAPGRLPELRAKYRAAAERMEVSLLVRYTDFLGHRLRWTCANYRRASPKGLWTLNAVYYDDRELR